MASVLLAINLQLVQVTTSLLTRPSHLRKSSRLLNCSPLKTNRIDSEAQAGKQVVSTTSTRATGVWPMQGGLQTITNNATTRTQTVASIQGQAPPIIKTEAVTTSQDARQTKTPSPKKAIIAGQENVTSTTPQSAE